MSYLRPINNMLLFPNIKPIQYSSKYFSYGLFKFEHIFVKVRKVFRVFLGYLFRNSPIIESNLKIEEFLKVSL